MAVIGDDVKCGEPLSGTNPIQYAISLVKLVGN